MLVKKEFDYYCCWESENFLMCQLLAAVTLKLITNYLIFLLIYNASAKFPASVLLRKGANTKIC